MEDVDGNGLYTEFSNNLRQIPIRYCICHTVPQPTQLSDASTACTVGSMMFSRRTEIAAFRQKSVQRGGTTLVTSTTTDVSCKEHQGPFSIYRWMDGWINGSRGNFLLLKTCKAANQLSSLSPPRAVYVYYVLRLLLDKRIAEIQVDASAAAFVTDQRHTTTTLPWASGRKTSVL